MNEGSNALPDGRFYEHKICSRCGKPIEQGTFHSPMMIDTGSGITYDEAFGCTVISRPSAQEGKRLPDTLLGWPIVYVKAIIRGEE